MKREIEGGLGAKGQRSQIGVILTLQFNYVCSTIHYLNSYNKN